MQKPNTTIIKMCPHITVSVRKYIEQSHSTETVCLHGLSKHKLIRETYSLKGRRHGAPPSTCLEVPERRSGFQKPSGASLRRAPAQFKHCMLYTLACVCPQYPYRGLQQVSVTVRLTRANVVRALPL